MATFLELCTDLNRDAGLSGSGPSAVTGQSGMNGKIVNWINDAWYEIQSARNNWGWMWHNTGSVDTVIGQQSYDLPGLGFDFEEVISESVSIQRQGQPNTIMQLEMISYDEFRERTSFIPLTSSQPIFGALTPADHLVVNTLPETIYTIKFEWYEKASFMSTNLDVPAMPLPYHRMIVERALMKYGTHDGAPEIYQAADREYSKWLRRLERSQLPVVETTGCLA